MADNFWHEDEEELPPSKTKIKKEHLAMQSLADRMTGLTEKELIKLGISDELRAGVAEARKMKASGARNRQLKYCVKRMKMEEETLKDVQLYLDDRNARQVTSNLKHHRLELLRDKLVKEGDNAIEPALEEHPSLERQRLRQFVREINKEQKAGKPIVTAKKLFKYLKEMILTDQ